ncbi:MAG TPA: NAD(P)-binding domain-containing protein [Aggregatilineales bacterium]|nr:NAD(P)-binding domain-containing protein [Anaerolineales bacterium]HRE47411.1 NAD(P)-binding domain-containing protein [Aggregatilineales bacterium]
MEKASLPVAVIGAGPIGMAAAAHLLQRGETPLVLEAGAEVGASILEWGHVRLFTPWRYATDRASTALLETAGWVSPDPEQHPTGADLVNAYLRPLANVPQLRPHIRVNSRVIRIARAGYDKMKTAGREQAPFLLTVRTKSGEDIQYLAKAVIDASGTYRSPNPLGANGTPVLGEEGAAEQIFYGIPNVLGEHRARYANKTILVAGSGASAFNVLLDLTHLAEDAPETKVIWVIRRALTKNLFGGGEADELPARGSLGQRVKVLVETGVFQVVDHFKAAKLQRVGEQIQVSSEGTALNPVDEIIVTTGFRPDLSLFSELRVALDPSVESPAALATMIDPNVHSCGTVPPHGAEELKQPEQDFYIVGSKSYGRAPTFLLLTGYEQVRSVAAAIVGDWDSAREVHLELPQTGTCCTTPDAPLGGTCCGTAASGESAVHSPLIALAEIPVTASPIREAAVGVGAVGQAIRPKNQGCCG